MTRTQVNLAKPLDLLLEKTGEHVKIAPRKSGEQESVDDPDIASLLHVQGSRNATPKQA